MLHVHFEFGGGGGNVLILSSKEHKYQDNRKWKVHQFSLHCFIFDLSNLFLKALKTF